MISKDDAAKQRTKREEVSLLKKKDRKSINDYCLTSDLVSRFEKLQGTGGSATSWMELP